MDGFIRHCPRDRPSVQSSTDQSETNQRTDIIEQFPKVDSMFPKVDWMFPKVDGMFPKVDSMFPKVGSMFPKVD